MKTWMRSLFITSMLTVFLQSSGFALTNEEVFSQFQFNFITPGARATALGGAFVGLADDATAIESNPAGLTQLYDPEVSIEYKHIAYTTNQIYENVPASGEIVAGNMVRRDFNDFVRSIPFISVAFPYKSFVFSLYRQELVNYKSAYRTSQARIGMPGYIYPDNYIFPIDALTDLTITNYGIGFAVQPIEGFSLAISPRWSEMEMQSHSKRYNNLVSPYITDFSSTELANQTEIDDHDAKFSLNAGLLWRLKWLEEKLHIPRVSLGGVYRSGPKFKVTETLSSAFIPSTVQVFSERTKFRLKVPDSFGCGIALQPINDLTFTLDVIHIQYQDLLEDFGVLFYPQIYTKENYSIDNATEVHVGVEYVLNIGERLLALRAGVYHEPDHTIRFTRGSGQPFEDTLQRELFRGGDAQFHFTGGVGLVVNDHFQIDTAANIANKNKQLSVSAVYRF